MGSELLTSEYVPDVVEQDFRNPHHSPFLVIQRRLQDHIFNLSTELKDWQVEVVKMRRNCVPTVQIMKRLNKSAAVINNFVKRDPRYKELYWRLDELEALEAGPSRSQRRIMLHTIAELNKDLDPKTAILAIAEQNKMDDSDKKVEMNQGGPAQIEININTETLPRTVLDG